MSIQLLADELWHARSTGTLDRLTDMPIEDISIEAAYDVQDGFVAKQLAHPDAIAGWKVGCTSRAIREQFGLNQPVAARIFRSQVHHSGATLEASAFIDCAVEAEIVFRIADGVPAAVGIGIELHHYRFFHGQPSSQELIAGNALQAGIVLGELHDVATVGALEGVRTDLVVNGEVVATGVGADILDAGPTESLRWLQSHLDRRGQRLADGDVVEARAERLGRCTVTFG